MGDVWFLFSLGSLLYIAGDEFPRWDIDRRRGLFVLALVLTYIGLIGILKNVFALPRPPSTSEPPTVRWLPSAVEMLIINITTADGSGFPSGHALGSTMVWGGLVLVLDRGTSRLRVGIAGGVVMLVSLSRLVPGVHYLIDVVVGVAIGITQLLMAITFDSVAALGGAVGRWLVWRHVADATPAQPRSGRWERHAWMYGRTFRCRLCV